MKTEPTVKQIEIMRYLITSNAGHPFVSQWFEAENHFNPDCDMIVYDLKALMYTTDGYNWQDIKEDHL